MNSCQLLSRCVLAAAAITVLAARASASSIIVDPVSATDNGSYPYDGGLSSSTETINGSNLKDPANVAVSDTAAVATGARHRRLVVIR